MPHLRPFYAVAAGASSRRQYRISKLGHTGKLALTQEVGLEFCVLCLSMSGARRRPPYNSLVLVGSSGNARGMWRLYCCGACGANWRYQHGAFRGPC